MRRIVRREIDPPDRFPVRLTLRDRRAVRLEDVRELAPDMREAGHLGDPAGAVERVEAGIAVGMHPALEALQMIRGMRALPVDREAVPGRWRRGAEPGALVAHIGPYSRGRGAPVAGRLHLDRVRAGPRTGGGRRPSPSAKIAGPPRTCRPMASASGSSSFAELPTQSARVDRSRSMPSRPKIRLCRYNGRWSPYFETSTWASSPGPGRPRSIGREGSGAWQNASQHRRPCGGARSGSRQSGLGCRRAPR